MRIFGTFISVVLVFSGVMFSGVTVVAQSWDSLYIQATEELEAGRWQEAVTKLQKAIMQNPRSGHIMRTDVTTTVGYFPYFLLGKAYYHLGKHEEALGSFGQEDPARLPAKIAYEISTYQSAIRSFQATKRLNEFKRFVDKAEAARKEEAFGEAAGHLERAREISKEEFEKKGLGRLLAQTLHLRAKQQAEKETAARFETILGQASQKEKEGALQAARSLLRDAEQLLPGRTEANELQTRIEQREARYVELKDGASLDEKQDRFGLAIEKLKQAADADPERFEDEQLGKLVDSLSNRQAVQEHFKAAAKALEDRSYQQAIAQFDLILQKDPTNATAVAEKARVRSLELFSRGQKLAMDGSFDRAVSAFGLALISYRSNGYLVYDQMRLYTERLRGSPLEQRWLDVMENADPVTFKRENVKSRQAAVQRPARQIARSPNTRPPSAVDDALRDASYSALSGPPQEAIQKLDRVRSNQKTGSAELERAAGIAYARLSLLTADPAERERLRAKAKQHFRIALAIKPGQTLNSRLVSPQIVKLFDEVREER